MRVARLFAVLVAFAVIVSPRRACADGEPAETRAPDDHARFAATFRFAGSSVEEAARRAAIDRAIDSLFFAIRGIARSRLSSGTRIDPWVSFSFDAGKIRSRTASARDAVSPEDGAVVDYVNEGDSSKLSQRIAAGKLTQSFVADEGRRVNEWAVSADGTTLTLKVTVSSPKLSRPVVYVLTYKRAP